MEPTEQAPGTPPKRRRRRWLIASIVLVLVSMVSWWYWPRGDARFVGKWRMLRTPETAIEQDDLVLNRNGTGYFSEGGKFSHFRWSFENERLCIGWLGDGIVGNALHQSAIKLNRTLGVSFQVYLTKYRVINVVEESFDMELDREGAFGHPLDRRYDRIPE